MYRLIFLFVAEERDLLHPAGASPASKQRYLEYYSATRIRNVARRHRTDDRHDDLWRSLRVTFDLLAGHRSGLELSPLAGGLFGDASCPDLDAALLSNAALAQAVTKLSYVRTRKLVRRVNYRDMDSEELGGVYEGLLERQPRVRVETATFELVGSGERKSQGAYYTPSSLVQELIKSALEPVTADRLAKAKTVHDKEQALLRIAVCDPACGSGHFLLAAARRLAGELAKLRAGDAEPTPGQLRHALRDVIRCCIYGVDLNPLAVDLCKLALWLEGHEPGLPLAFLDHRIRVGNSLVGATPEVLAQGLPDEAFDPVTGDDRAVAKAVKAANRQARKGGQLSLEMFPAGSDAVDETAALKMLEIAALPDDTVGQVGAKAGRYWASQEQISAQRLRADAWAASFFWELKPDPHPRPPTDADLRAGGPGKPLNLSPAQRSEVRRLVKEHRFFHWQLEFPEVFAEGGFDCVLGNPPWERIKLQEEEFFAERDPEIAKAPNKAARQRLIDALPKSDPALHAAFSTAKHGAECASKFVRGSHRFDLTAVGDVNLYALFAEQDRSLLNSRGRAGVIIPTGIATDDSTKAFFGDLTASRSLAGLFDFENREGLFPDVDSRMKFCLLTATGGPNPAGEFAFFLTNTDQLRDHRRRFRLAPEDFALLNPNTRTCPVFRTKVDAELTRAIYRRVPVLVNEAACENPWAIQLTTMFHMSNDSGLFRSRSQLETEGWVGCGREYGRGSERMIPMYEGRLGHQFNHRYATQPNGELREATLAELEAPFFHSEPQFWVPEAETLRRLGRRQPSCTTGMLGHRRVARNTDERTVVACILPWGAASYGWILSLGPTAQDLTLLLSCYNSLVFDYLLREALSQPSIPQGTFQQDACIPPSAYSACDRAVITRHALELTYTAWDLKPFAEDLGYDGPPFPWDEERRALLRAEVDAYYAALYGLTRDELRYILDPADVYGPDFPGETFRVLKEKETKQYGEYRTRRLVLDAWDRLGLEPRNRDGRYCTGPGTAGGVQGLVGVPTPHLTD